MHLCSHTFYSHPENKLVADEYGIMITTSHREPLLFNNLSSFEWRSDRDGEWDYGTNRKTIYNKLDARVKEAAGSKTFIQWGCAVFTTKECEAITLWRNRCVYWNRLSQTKGGFCRRTSKKRLMGQAEMPVHEF